MESCEESPLPEVLSCPAQSATNVTAWDTLLESVPWGAGQVQEVVVGPGVGGHSFLDNVLYCGLRSVIEVIPMNKMLVFIF